MLGSASEADDAVQEAWLRLGRADAGGIENLRGWLTTVVARICLDMLRSRTSRREEPLGPHVPDPIESRSGGIDPEQEALLADSVGPALLVVLETLAPAERLAFVLHDLFGVSFDEIASIVGRSPAAARQLASRARRRVRGAAPTSSADVSRQREIVAAFLAASRNGDFTQLLALLDPDVVLRADEAAAAARARDPGRRSRRRCSRGNRPGRTTGTHRRRGGGGLGPGRQAARRVPVPHRRRKGRRDRHRLGRRPRRPAQRDAARRLTRAVRVGEAVTSAPRDPRSSRTGRAAQSAPRHRA
jgi:RNA polymerase sigma-70 factor (ECF subfamily)